MTGAESGYMGDAIAQSKDAPNPSLAYDTHLFRTMSALKVLVPIYARVFRRENT